MGIVTHDPSSPDIHMYTNFLDSISVRKLSNFKIKWCIKNFSAQVLTHLSYIEYHLYFGNVKYFTTIH